MKIAYIISPLIVLAGKSDGIRSQALTWGNILKSKGHKVDFIDVWEDYNWKEYDVIHFFGSTYTHKLFSNLRKKNNKCVFSPIYDPCYFIESKSQRIQLKVSKITQGKWNCTLYNVYNDFQGYQRYLVRSMYEKERIKKLFSINDDKIDVIHLSYSQNMEYLTSLPEKEKFVFHMSLFNHPRKNVLRLIYAARKYGFNLKIAGKASPQIEGYNEMMDIISATPNIELLGYISEEKKIELYKKAKVFALPSISEGVGIVAVDAALYGADIVITNIGGPKEYYNGMAEIVNPYSIDEIGQACMRLLNGKTYQPDLRKYINENYSLNVIADKLIHVYNSLQ